MGGFTKLDSGIVHSSIWSESATTRVVWITMLAMSNSEGLVKASASGIQRAANVSKEECDAALASFQNPDFDSRSLIKEGRRVERVDGGWLILNYQRYREFTYSENPEAVRKRKYREKQNEMDDGTCPDSDGQSGTSMGQSGTSRTILDSSASASASASGINSLLPLKGDARGKIFVKPTINQITAYCQIRGNNISPNKFYDFYESKGWKIGKNSMKDWQAAVRTWEGRDDNRPAPAVKPKQEEKIINGPTRQSGMVPDYSKVDY